MNLHLPWESDDEGVADSFIKKVSEEREELESQLTLKDSASASDAFKTQVNRAEFNDGI